MLAISGRVVETMDVWDEIYLPLIMLTRKANDVPFVLQARIAQPELDLITCYEELPATLQIMAFISTTKDKSLVGIGHKSAQLLEFSVAPALQNFSSELRRWLRLLTRISLPLALDVPAAGPRHSTLLGAGKGHRDNQLDHSLYFSGGIL